MFWALFTLWCPLYVAWKARRLKPDCYVVFGAYYSGCLKLAKIIVPARVILFLRALTFKIDRITEKPAWVRFFAEKVETCGIALADHVVCMSEAMKEELEYFLGRKLLSVSILPNDVPKVKKSLAVFKEPPIKSKFIVLTAGVIDQRKNIDFLLHAFLHLQKRHKLSVDQACLLIAGDGPLLDTCVRTTEQLGLENVRFLGWTESLGDYLRASSLLVHPSLHEGIPNVVLEAFAFDLPVLVSDIPELRELMHFPELTFDLLDPDVLADRIASLSQNPELMDRLKELCAQRKQILSFDWEARALGILNQSDTI